MSKSEMFVILGAGLAGLSAAYHLEKDYQIYEKEDKVGGLCRSVQLDGFTFDYGGHLLHFRYPYTRRLIRKLMGPNLLRHQRNSWIFSHNTFIRFPFQANLHCLPAHVAKECVEGALETQLGKKTHRPFNNGNNEPFNNGDNFEDWIFCTLGSGIAKHFMIPYNTKFWTIHPKQMSCEWLDGFVPVVSIKDIIKGAISREKKLWGYNWQFWYPKNGGIEQLPLAFARNIKKPILGKEAVRINIKLKRLEFKDGSRCNFDRLISTIPLPEMERLLSGPIPQEVKGAFKKLRYTSILTVDLVVDRPNLSENHWIYFPEKEFIFFRVGFPDNFHRSSRDDHKGSIYAEISFSKQRPIHKKKLVHRVISDMLKANLLSRQDKILNLQAKEIRYGYVIYDRWREEAVATLREFLKTKGIYSIGRWGRWKYMTMEDCILDGKDGARGFIEDGVGKV